MDPSPRIGGVRGQTNLNSSSVSWIMFWMKRVCRGVSGVAPPRPATSATFWDSEEDAAAAAGPEASNRTRVNRLLDQDLLSPWKQRRTCCSRGRSPEDGRVVAQLGLHAVGSAGAGLGGQEGRGRRILIGLLGCDGRSLSLSLRTGPAGLRLTEHREENQSLPPDV